ncbi:MAG: serine hydrolase domain-containing protein [Candidatus Aminicenantes bacterium]
MKKQKILTIFFLLIFQLTSFSTEIEERISNRLQKEIGPLIQKDMKRFKVPGLSAAVVWEGKTVWKKGFGYQNREQKIPAAPETVYRVGSISKLFNAISIMQQQEKGNLDIDSDIKEYLLFMHFENPFDQPGEFTLRHLLSHRAGILRECPVGHYFDDSEPSLAETVKSMVGTPLIYPPGMKTKYSNIGVGMAGHIMEKVAKMDFAGYQKEFILNPLGMKSSSFLLEDHIKEKVAKGYMRDLQGKQWEAPHFRFGYLPAANLYSTVIDLTKFMNFMMDEGKPLLERETFNHMKTVQFTQEQNQGFGLGFFISKIHNFRSIGHSGAVYGFSSNLLTVPQKKLGVVVCSNLDGANGFNFKLVFIILGVALEEITGQKILDLPVPFKIPTLKLKTYQGKYVKDGTPVWLVLRDEKFYYHPYGTRKQLTAVSTNGFITDDLTGYGERITVVKKEGRVRGININSTFYEKVKQEKQAPSPQWKKLIGDYGPDFNIMNIYVRDGRLTVLIEWFYEYPLQPLGNLKFKFPDYGLYMDEELVFKEKEGKITGAMVGPVNFNRRD